MFAINYIDSINESRCKVTNDLNRIIPTYFSKGFHIVSIIPLSQCYSVYIYYLREDFTVGSKILDHRSAADYLSRTDDIIIRVLPYNVVS